MEQPADILPVTTEEARFEVRLTYTAELLKQWQRSPVRLSRIVVRYVRPILGILLILVGLWNLWIKGQVLEAFFSAYGMQMHLGDYFSYWGEKLLLPVLGIGLGILEFFIERIRLRRSLKRMTAVYGPEPWPVHYLFGEEAFTMAFSGAIQTMPYARAKKVEEKGDFLLLWVWTMLFRIPKSAVTKGTPEELLAFLREKVSDRK